MSWEIALVGELGELDYRLSTRLTDSRYRQLALQRFDLTTASDALKDLKAISADRSIGEYGHQVANVLYAWAVLHPTACFHLEWVDG